MHVLAQSIALDVHARSSLWSLNPGRSRCASNGVPAGIFRVQKRGFSGVGILKRKLANECGHSGRLVSVRAASESRYGPQKQAQLAVRKGMELFRQGDVRGSLAEFDTALKLDSSQKPYLWQRGLSLYYLNEFEKGAAQFREDVAVNPNDTEEAIWCYLCEARLYGTSEARNRYLKVGVDSRPYMRKAYELFRDGGDPDILLQEAGTSDASGTWFYSKLYAGLYYESENDITSAKAAIQEAAGSEYAQRSGDYMAIVAEVHCSVRGWEPVIERSSDYRFVAMAILLVMLPVALLFSNRLRYKSLRRSGQ